MKKNLPLVVICIFLLSSCTIQKRYYGRGFTVNWHQRPHSAPAAVEQINTQEGGILTASTDTIILPQPVEKIIFKETVISKDSCDLLELRNNTTAKVKVMEISPTSIRYKKCDNLDGPEYVLNKTDVAAITYSNGEKEQFEIPIQPVTEELKVEKPVRQKADVEKLAWTFGTRSLVPFAGLVFSILGIIFSIIALVRLKRNPDQDPKKQKKRKIKLIVALILSIVGLLVAAMVITFFSALFIALGNID